MKLYAVGVETNIGRFSQTLPALRPREMAAESLLAQDCNISPNV